MIDGEIRGGISRLGILNMTKYRKRNWNFKNISWKIR